MDEAPLVMGMDTVVVVLAAAVATRSSALIRWMW